MPEDLMDRKTCRCGCTLPEEKEICTYCAEDDMAQSYFDYKICGSRTSNGAPWAMPCTLSEGHDGQCSWDHDRRIFLASQDAPTPPSNTAAPN